MTEEVAFALRDVGYTYPGGSCPVLRGINLEVRKGEWLALIGSNGSGKSTLARLLNALLVPTQGDCFICGMRSDQNENVWNIRSMVSMVFQNPDNQIVASVVEDDTAFGPENLGISSDEIISRVKWALRATGLYELRRKATYALSGGQKQRLAIAGALAMYPPVIVLDEPTAMLDPQGRKEIHDVLSRLNEKGITIIYITHRLEEILDCDRVVVLDEGTIALDTSPEQLFSSIQELDRWGLEIPSIVRLWSLLRMNNIIYPEIKPKAEEVLAALCQ